jgi:hypothetical protein
MKRILLIVAALLCTSVFAHSGGTGCHHDHKNGGYHCHFIVTV